MNLIEALQAKELGEVIQIEHLSGSWDECSWDARIYWYFDKQFRIKPKQININGNLINAPIKDKLKSGDDYWFVNILTYAKVYESVWENDSIDNSRLDRGLIHLTKEDALAHANALLSFTENKSD